MSDDASVTTETITRVAIEFSEVTNRIVENICSLLEPMADAERQLMAKNVSRALEEGYTTGEVVILRDDDTERARLRWDSSGAIRLA